MANVMKGLEGSVTWAGTAIANIKNWSLTIDIGSLDTTAFGETNTSAIQGLRNATGQISGDLSNDARQVIALGQASNAGVLANVAIVFIGSTVSGRLGKWTAAAAQLTNIQVGSEVAGVASFSASVQCSGGVLFSNA